MRYNLHKPNYELNDFIMIMSILIIKKVFSVRDFLKMVLLNDVIALRLAFVNEHRYVRVIC